MDRNSPIGDGDQIRLERTILWRCTLFGSASPRSTSSFAGRDLRIRKRYVGWKKTHPIVITHRRTTCHRTLGHHYGPCELIMADFQSQKSGPSRLGSSETGTGVDRRTYAGNGTYAFDPIVVTLRQPQTSVIDSQERRNLGTGKDSDGSVGYYKGKDSQAIPPGEKVITSAESRIDTVQTPVAGGASITMYRLRARDSACALSNPNRYVYWTSSQKTLLSYGGSLPCGGPLVELYVVSKWMT